MAGRDRRQYLRKKGKAMKNEKKQRERLWRETAGHCVYCGHPVSPEEMEVDHIEPWSQGKDNSFLNKVCCCKECNRLKGNRLVEDFLLEEYSEDKLAKYENRIDNLVKGGYMSPVKAISLTPLQGLYDNPSPWDPVPGPRLVFMGCIFAN